MGKDKIPSMTYLLVSTLDKSCREFLANNDVSTLSVVDWYKEDVNHIIELGLSPSSFPALGVELPQTGGLEAKWVLIGNFDTLAAANKIVDDLTLEREQAGAELPPLPAKPDIVGFLTALNTNQDLPVSILPFLILWTPEQVANDLARKGFWARVKSNNLPFMTPEVVATIEAVAISFNLPLI